MAKKYDLNSYDKMMSDLGAAYKKAVTKGVISAGVRLIQVIQTEIIPRETPVPVDRGIYRAGWQFSPAKDGVRVFNKAPHGIFVEYGIKNVVIGGKLIKALAEWVRRKGIGSKVVTRKSKGETVSRVQKASMQDAIKIAYAIANSAKKKGGFPAGKRGIGRRIFERARKRMPFLIVKEVVAELAKV